MNHDKMFFMVNIYLQYVILANMYHFIRQDHIMATQSEKKLIKAAEIVKYVVSELGSISSISCFDKEKCLFLETKLIILNINFQMCSPGSTFV